LFREPTLHKDFFGHGLRSVTIDTCLVFLDCDWRKFGRHIILADKHGEISAVCPLIEMIVVKTATLVSVCSFVGYVAINRRIWLYFDFLIIVITGL
jgi:hypothetical protein